MTDLSPGLIVLLLAALIGGVLVIRFARQIAHFLLIAGALAVAGLIAWALVAQATASRRIADTAHIAVAAQARTDTLEAITTSLLVIAIVAALGLAIYCARWKLTERRLERQRQGGWAPGPNALWGREQQPQPPPYVLPSAPTYYAPYPPPPPPAYYLPAGYYPPYPPQYPLLAAPEGDEGEGEWWGWFEG